MIPVKITLQGDKYKARYYVQHALRMLAEFGRQIRATNNLINSPSMSQLKKQVVLDSGNVIITVQEIFGLREITIFAAAEIPVSGLELEKQGLFLYIVTVAKPYPTEKICTLDEMGNSIYKYYVYKILKNGGVIIPAKGPKIITNIGRNLTCQQGENRLYCDLSVFNLHSHDIGGIIPANPLDCDMNTYWGYPKQNSTVCFLPFDAYWGSDRAEQKPAGPLLPEGYRMARHNYSLDAEGKFDGNQFLYSIVETIYDDGCLWLPDRVDAQSLYKRLGGHRISHFDKAGAWIHNVVLTDHYTDKHNWIYHIPIMAIAKDKFLYRSHEKIGTNAQYGDPSGYVGSFQDWSCYEAELTEKLVVGDEVVDTFIGTVSNKVVGQVLTGSDTVTRPTTSLYIFDGCPEVEWSVSGGGGAVTINQSGVVTVGSSACGTFTVVASCPMCGTSDSMDVLITNAGQWKPLPYAGGLSSDICWTYHYWAGHETVGLEKKCFTQIIEGIRHQVSYGRQSFSISDPSCHCGNYEWKGNPSVPGSFCGSDPKSPEGSCFPYTPCGTPCFFEWRKYRGQTCEWLCSWSGGGCGLGEC